MPLEQFRIACSWENLDPLGLLQTADSFGVKPAFHKGFPMLLRLLGGPGQRTEMWLKSDFFQAVWFTAYASPVLWCYLWPAGVQQDIGWEGVLSRNNLFMAQDHCWAQMNFIWTGSDQFSVYPNIQKLKIKENKMSFLCHHFNSCVFVGEWNLHLFEFICEFIFDIYKHKQHLHFFGETKWHSRASWCLNFFPHFHQEIFQLHWGCFNMMQCIL